jgi:chromosome segregation ATPase
MTPTMTPTNNLPAQLREYNRWRRGGEGIQPNPSKIGAMIDEAADRLEELEMKNKTFRAAQKACEDCDAPRVDRIDELEREIAVWKHEAKRLEDEFAKFDETAIEWWCEYQDLKAKAREP